MWPGPMRPSVLLIGNYPPPYGGVPRYIELLSAGGSRSPEELGRIVGVDLADPGFWDKGLALVERQLEAAETAAREAGRI